MSIFLFSISHISPLFSKSYNLFYICCCSKCCYFMNLNGLNNSGSSHIYISKLFFFASCNTSIYKGSSNFVVNKINFEYCFYAQILDLSRWLNRKLDFPLPVGAIIMLFVNYCEFFLNGFLNGFYSFWIDKSLFLKHWSYYILLILY